MLDKSLSDCGLGVEELSIGLQIGVVLLLACKALDSEENDMVMGDITAFVCCVVETNNGFLNCPNSGLDVIGNLNSATSFSL